MFSPTSPITGAAITGLTTPTYTFVTDIAPAINGKQFAVTALGGTQTGVTVNTPNSPFTGTFFRPTTFKMLGTPNPTTGVIANVPKNTYKLIARKGVLVAANQSPQVAEIDIVVKVPAGSETYDAPNLNALFSFAGALMSNQLQGIRDTVTSGVS